MSSRSHVCTSFDCQKLHQLLRLQQRNIWMRWTISEVKQASTLPTWNAWAFKHTLISSNHITPAHTVCVGESCSLISSYTLSVCLLLVPDEQIELTITSYNHHPFVYALFDANERAHLRAQPCYHSAGMTATAGLLNRPSVTIWCWWNFISSNATFALQTNWSTLQ